MGWLTDLIRKARKRSAASKRSGPMATRTQPAVADGLLRAERLEMLDRAKRQERAFGLVGRAVNTLAEAAQIVKEHAGAERRAAVFGLAIAKVLPQLGAARTVLAGGETGFEPDLGIGQYTPSAATTGTAANPNVVHQVFKPKLVKS